MNKNEFLSFMEQAAQAYYRGQHPLGNHLLKGSLRIFSFLPLETEQAVYVNTTMKAINETYKKQDYTRIADILMFEFVANFPGFDSLFKNESADEAL